MTVASDRFSEDPFPPPPHLTVRGSDAEVDQVLKISMKGLKESGAIDYFRLYLMSHIIRLALAEAGVLIGFVLIMTSNQKEWMGFALLAVAALMAILNEIPPYESVKAHIQHLDPQAKV